MTGYVNPYWCFGIVAIFGGVVIISAFSLTNQLENESDIEVELATQADGTMRRRSFCEEIKHNWRIVKNMFKERLYQRILLFYLLYGITIPSFAEYLYYFKLEVAELTQF